VARRSTRRRTSEEANEREARDEEVWWLDSARRGEEEPSGRGRARVRSARWLASSSSIRLGEEGRRRKKGGRARDIYSWPFGTGWKGDPVPKEALGTG
jgi:hypothetical protein